MSYTEFNKIIHHDPIPSFEDNTHIVTPSTSHKDLWIWTSKKDPTSMFCITAALQWLKDNYRIIPMDAIPILDHFKSDRGSLNRSGMNHSNDDGTYRIRTRNT